MKSSFQLSDSMKAFDTRFANQAFNLTIPGPAAGMVSDAELRADAAWLLFGFFVGSAMLTFRACSSGSCSG